MIISLMMNPGEQEKGMIRGHEMYNKANCKSLTVHSLTDSGQMRWYRGFRSTLYSLSGVYTLLSSSIGKLLSMQERTAYCSEPPFALRSFIRREFFPSSEIDCSLKEIRRSL